MQMVMDRLLLRMPIFGELIMKSVVARWTRTLSTLFAAGVPLVEALDSVGGTAGNAVYAKATEQIQRDVAAGTALTPSMTTTGVFPNMVLQMAAIGEESGALDDMLSRPPTSTRKRWTRWSRACPPDGALIIVILGVLIGGIVVSMYLPIFKLGQVV
jgi:type IV pilus assembly protein PilC